MTIGGGYIDDAAMALGHHHAQLMLHAEQSAENVGVEGGRIALGSLLRHRTGLALGSGVVDGDVEATEARDGFIDQVSYLVLVAHIGIHVFRLRVESTEFSQ